MRNNLFDFATSELSQDAFICWCVNWFNDDSNASLKEMAISLIKRFVKLDCIESVDIYRQYISTVYVDGEMLSLKIDVLLVVNREVAVIIEDKTDSTLHDDQLKRYKKGLAHEISTGNTLSKLEGVKSIVTVYFKTGFFYDEDVAVEADIVVNGTDFLNILSPYEGDSEILDSYVASLREHLRFEKRVGNYEDVKGEVREWNIVCCALAQYRLMRDIFSEELWKDKSDWIYRVYDGSSFGRPWTQMEIYEGNYKESGGSYSVFWRIDTDNNGPYISLRLYEKFDKNDSIQKDRHKKAYEFMSAIAREIVDQSDFFDWDDLYPGYRGNYKESSLLHINLVQLLKDWKCKKDIFVVEMQRITDEFRCRLGAVAL